MTKSTRIKRWGVMSAVLSGSTMFQLGFLPSCETLATVFNPCGTILGFCEQADLDLLFADGIPDYELDPTCTIPFGTGGGCAGGPIFPNPGRRP